MKYETGLVGGAARIADRDPKPPAAIGEVYTTLGLADRLASACFELSNRLLGEMPPSAPSGAAAARVTHSGQIGMLEESCEATNQRIHTALDLIDRIDRALQ